MILLKIFSMVLTCVSSSSSSPIIPRVSFFIVSHNSLMFYAMRNFTYFIFSCSVVPNSSIVS